MVEASESKYVVMHPKGMMGIVSEAISAVACITEDMLCRRMSLLISITFIVCERIGRV
jgi:hypothetical protein